MTPVIERLGIDGLTNLLRTGGSDGPFVPVVAQAGRLEIETAIIQHLPDFDLRVLYKLFIDDSVDAAGHDGVKVGHKPDIVAVMGSDVFQIETEGLPSGEMLLESRKAAGKGVSTGINDSRSWQDPVNQSDMQKIIGHLVDEQRTSEFSLRPGSLKIFRTKSGAFIV